MSGGILHPNSLYLEDTKRYCFMPYIGHPKGCPNCYGKCWGSGNKQIGLGELVDLNRPYYLIYNEFNLELHAQKMKVNHPSWSGRQCRCVLYWQGTARKQLREYVSGALQQVNPTPDFITYIPELYGVNVYVTCLEIGLVLDSIVDMQICRHVALLGYKLGAFEI